MATLKLVLHWHLLRYFHLHRAWKTGRRHRHLERGNPAAHGFHQHSRYRLWERGAGIGLIDACAQA